MRGGRGRAPRVREGPKARFNLEKLRVLIVDAGPILSLAGMVILAGGLVVWITIRELRDPALILRLTVTIYYVLTQNLRFMILRIE